MVREAGPGTGLCVLSGLFCKDHMLGAELWRPPSDILSEDQLLPHQTFSVQLPLGPKGPPPSPGPHGWGTRKPARISGRPEHVWARPWPKLRCDGLSSKGSAFTKLFLESYFSIKKKKEKPDNKNLSLHKEYASTLGVKGWPAHPLLRRKHQHGSQAPHPKPITVADGVGDSPRPRPGITPRQPSGGGVVLEGTPGSFWEGSGDVVDSWECSAASCLTCCCVGNHCHVGARGTRVPLNS